jgi:hypothetical protein
LDTGGGKRYKHLFLKQNESSGRTAFAKFSQKEKEKEKKKVVGGNYIKEKSTEKMKE